MSVKNNFWCILASVIILTHCTQGIAQQEQAPLNEAETIEYAPGQLVVKLRANHQAEELSSLLDGFQASLRPLFPKRPDLQKTQQDLQDQSNAISNPHKRLILDRRRVAIENRINRLNRRQKRGVGGDTFATALEAFYLVTTSEENLSSLQTQLEQHPAVLETGRNYRVQQSFVPNDPNWGNDQMYGLRNMHFPEAWDITPGRPDVVIAIVERAIDVNHEDLFDNLWINEGEIPNNNLDDDNNGYVDDIYGAIINASGYYDPNVYRSDHGTMVAGFAAAVGNNATGIIGAAWGSKIMAAIYNNFSTDAAAAIIYAADNGADVINMSFGYTFVGAGNDALKAAVDYAHAAGCVLVAGTGNDNSSLLSSAPARYSNTIAVGAVDELDIRAPFSNFGVDIDVVAPGVQVQSTYPGNLYHFGDGTSFSTPYVSGLAALIISRNLDLHESNPSVYPLLSNESIRQIIDRSADDIVHPAGGTEEYAGFDTYTGYGRVNAQKALNSMRACEANLNGPAVTYAANYGGMFENGGYAFSIGYREVSGVINVYGIANSENFSGYVLEIGEGQMPDDWQELISANHPILGTTGQNVIFSGLNTNLLNNGPHTLRLTVSSSTGETCEDRMMIDIIRALITLPEKNPALGLKPILFCEPSYIDGSAKGPNFERAYLEHGAGRDPTSWTKITANRTAAINHGNLFNVDFLALPNGIGTLRLVVEDTILGRSVFPVVVDVDSIHFPSQTGFPIQDSVVNHAGRSAIVTADLDQDGLKEIIFAADSYTGSSYLLAYKLTGEQLFQTVVEGEINSAPAVGNLDSDPQLEIALKYQTKENGQIAYEHVELFDSNGAKLEGWPTQTGQLYHSCQTSRAWGQSSVVLVDLDDDGIHEILFGGSLSFAGKVFIYRPNGQAYPGWENGIDTGGIVLSTPAVGDIDHDGSIDIVTRCGDNFLYAWHNNGESMWSQKVDAVDYYTTNSIALADFDHDDDLEIVVPGDFPRSISIWDHTGSRIMYRALESIPTDQTDAYPFSLGDLNHDGEPEIYIPTSLLHTITQTYSFEIYRVDADGTTPPGWPVAWDKSIFPGYFLIGDADGNGTRELLFAQNGDGAIYALDQNGALLDNEYWPIRGLGTYQRAMAMDDLDGDGDTELVSVMSYGALRVWDLASRYAPDTMSWTMFQVDAQNTGHYMGFGADACPGDPNKTITGICGCGVAETDTDNDGRPDCLGQCLTPGQCDDTGNCTSPVSRVCDALDYCHLPGVCDPLLGCSNPAKENGTDCDDHVACTASSSCQEGICVGTEPVVCEALDDCHLAGVCDPVFGCSNPVKDNGIDCDDHDLCTTSSTCQEGVCVGSEPVVCEAGKCEIAGICNPENGACSAPTPKPDETLCNDGLYCTVNDKCVSSLCVGEQRECTQGVSCRTGVCNEQEDQCSGAPIADGSACKTDVLCATFASCQEGVCVVAEDMACEALDDCHLAGECDPELGCSNPVKDNGAECDDHDLCNATSSCQEGICVGSDPVVCEAGLCEIPGICNPETGQCSAPTLKPDEMPCNDGLFCTVGDKCVAGLCVGEQRECTQGVYCRTGVCDEHADRCDGALIADGSSCDDGEWCTYDDQCQNGECVGSTYSCTSDNTCEYLSCVGDGTCLSVNTCEVPSKPDKVESLNLGDGCTCNSSANSSFPMEFLFLSLVFYWRRRGKRSKNGVIEISHSRT